MHEWFCSKCRTRKMTQSNKQKSAVLDNGVIHHIDGVVCPVCTEKLAKPVLMWPLPESKDGKEP